MAMFVLLSFPDDADAIDWVQRMKGDSESLVVEGIYKKPTLFCDLTDTIHGNRRVTGFTKGQKWGWWVCAVCKKPRKLSIDNLPNEVCGYNLMDRLFPKPDTDFESGKDLSTLARLPASDI
jgi:hypothetical protein